MTDVGQQVSAAIQRHNASMDAARETARALASERAASGDDRAADTNKNVSAAVRSEQE